MLFDRLFRKARAPRRQVRRLRLERLLSRELLAADFGAIGGVVVNDLQGNGVDGADPVMVGVPIALYADSNGNGVFDAPGSGAPDNNIANDVTDATGAYLFDRLAEGRYFVVQNPTTSGSQLAGETVASVEITAALANGTNNNGEILVDEFNGTTQTIASPIAPVTTGNSILADGGVLGGERDILLTRTGVGTVTVEVNSGAATDTFAFTGGVNGTRTA